MPAIPPPPGGASARAIPTSFRVATSTAPRSQNDEEAALYSAFQSQAASRAISTASPSSLKVKLDWIEKLSSPGVSLATLKASLDFLDPTSWHDLVVERHMEGLCPYPTCTNKAATPFEPAGAADDDHSQVEKKFKLHGGALYDAGPSSRAGPGDHKGPYCSLKCRARSEWVKGVLGKEGRRDVLLEDVEHRRERVKETTEQLVREKQERTTDRGEVEVEATKGPSAKDAFQTDLLSSLTIHERPNTVSDRATPPVAPSLEQGAIDFERPVASTRASTSTSRFPVDLSTSSLKPLSNPGSALLPFTTKSLGRTVLSSSRRSSAMPVPAARQPRTGMFGLPPVKFLSEPRMVDSDGREIEWADADGDDGLEGEEAELVRNLLDEALEVRRLVDRGEL
ncbi:hypothetical protein JCM3766R1_001291 [Sporobolomyces carnicolor]